MVEVGERHERSRLAAQHADQQFRSREGALRPTRGPQITQPPMLALYQPGSGSDRPGDHMRTAAATLRGQAVPSGCSSARTRSSSRRGGAQRVQAVAAPPSAMKVFRAESMDEAQLKEFASRPRVDFTSILGTVRRELEGWGGGGGGVAAAGRQAAGGSLPARC